MSKFTEGSLFFKKRVGTYADGWGEVTDENRNWEDAYRDRWAHDKIVRSTHGVNCTGSCSWKIYVKDGIVTWETQQTDYPPTPCGVPNHEPVAGLVVQGIRGISTARRASSIRSSALNFAMHGAKSALITSPSKHGSASSKIPKPVKAT